MHMRDEASSFFNSNNIVEMQTQDQEPLLSNGWVERLSAIPPLQRLAGMVISLERGNQMRQPLRTALGDLQIKRTAISNFIQFASPRKAFLAGHLDTLHKSIAKVGYFTDIRWSN